MNETDDLMKQVRELEKFRAPAHLREKLLAIPQEHPRVQGFAARFKRVLPVGLAAAAMLLLYTHFSKKEFDPQVPQYSREQIETARQELELAFHYLHDVSQQAGVNLNQRVTESSTQALYKGVFYPLLDESAALKGENESEDASASGELQ